MGENNKKDGQSATIFLIPEKKKEKKIAYRYLFRMSDEESQSARKRMWKITSGVFIVFFLRIALKKHVINNLLTSSVRS